MTAYIALYSWPVVVIILFSLCSRPVAVLASIIAGYLLLPTQVSLDLQGLPELGKDMIPAIAVFFVVVLTRTSADPDERPGWMLHGILPKLLLAALVAGAFLTVFTNSDTLAYGPKILPALRPWDAFSMGLSALILLLPLFLGRKFLAHPKGQRLVLIALAIAGLIYSFLALYEIRMSPQLNNMVYDFFPHAWLQHIRNGGFRPVVFLWHGLWLATFFSATILAAFGMFRLAQGRQRMIYLGIGLWILMTLALSSALSALAVTLVLVPIALLMPRHGQLIVAAIIAAIVLFYPTLRGAELVPVDRILAWANNIDPNRAASLSFRLANEDLLLDKAQGRALFGWGGWGRNFVFNQEGIGISLADGYWVLIIGQGGWSRYLAEFGLLCLPVILAAIRARKYDLGPETAVLALILAGNLVDLIPNATITPLTWMIAGAVWGRLELGRITEDQDIPDQVPDATEKLVWTRTAEPVTGSGESGQKVARARYTRQSNWVDRSTGRQDGKRQ